MSNEIFIYDNNKYYQKYLKYKKKYLMLLHGGDPETDKQKLITDIKKEITTIKNKKPSGYNEYETVLQKFVTDQVQNFLDTHKADITDINIQNWTWTYVVKKILESKPDKIDGLTKSVIGLRQFVVDTLLELIFFIKDDCLSKSKSQEIVCEKTASGSVGTNANLHSDYDLTITGSFTISSIIQIFNSVIKKTFNKVSAEVFDTNIYGYSFLIPATLTLDNKNWKYDKISENPDPDPAKAQICKPKPKCHYTLYGTDKNRDQDMWAYKRLVTMMNKKNSLLILGTKITIHMPTTDIKQSKYIEKMENFETIMNDKKDFSEPNTNMLINALSEMNFYGDDTYFTQGSFLHVVGTLFYYSTLKNDEKINLLTIQHLIHSMIENLAYLIHDIQNSLDATTLTPLQKMDSVFKASKYLQRFINAYILIQNKLDKKDLVDKEIYEFLEFIKNNIRNRTENEIKINNDIKSKYKIQNITNILELKKKIFKEFVTNMNALTINYDKKILTVKTFNVTVETFNVNELLDFTLSVLHHTLTTLASGYTSFKITKDESNNKYTITIQ
jgi:hypothetical protein